MEIEKKYSDRLFNVDTRKQKITYFGNLSSDLYSKSYSELKDFFEELRKQKFVDKLKRLVNEMDKITPNNPQYQSLNTTLFNRLNYIDNNNNNEDDDYKYNAKEIIRGSLYLSCQIERNVLALQDVVNTDFRENNQNILIWNLYQEAIDLIEKFDTDVIKKFFNNEQNIQQEEEKIQDIINNSSSQQSMSISREENNSQDNLSDSYFLISQQSMSISREENNSQDNLSDSYFLTSVKEKFNSCQNDVFRKLDFNKQIAYFLKHFLQDKEKLYRDIDTCCSILFTTYQNRNFWDDKEKMDNMINDILKNENIKEKNKEGEEISNGQEEIEQRKSKKKKKYKLFVKNDIKKLTINQNLNHHNHHYKKAIAKKLDNWLVNRSVLPRIPGQYHSSLNLGTICKQQKNDKTKM